ncbi:2-hydroxyacid dehydrogenase [Komagataeibacter medellinensis]|uniref:D-isomer-specific 2-hydroxyacid dehydrogenase n=1 Tax=Komagataeibacter medellinensis (strain NBRC 3288 / BCRC 11682 / LMG 1693 / Kondo 51) TaxID=634177 RepID=G2I5V8_KOMMN|nr:D-glycerate dehydrogenase [Komagataeibacter medellinensis]BAK83505.1 D-isomer-specific 2-hydroxyacid dehydrogenase [Komagataeibacter medellinensis NBRC 3288]
MSDTQPRLLLTQRQTPAVMQRIEHNFTISGAPDHKMTTRELLDTARAFQPDAIMTSTGLPLQGDDVKQLPDCVKVVATVSVGTDHLDIPALHARGIIVTNTPDVLTQCNADMAILLMLAAARRAGEYTTLMRRGWGQSLAMDELLGTRISGKRLGIVGMGRIGRAVAKRARGFDMEVLYSNRRRLPAEQEAGATYFATIADMLPHCDILSLHMPASPETDGMINADLLGRLPRGAIFINAARGALVDEDALIDALRSGQLAAAGLDVYRNEPNPDPRFLELPNVFLTPHVGSATVETRTDMGMLALDNVEAVLKGAHPPTPVGA